MDTISIKTGSGIKDFKGAGIWDEIESTKQFVRLFKLSRFAVDSPHTRFFAAKLLYGLPDKYLMLIFNDPRRLTDDDMMLSGADRSLLMGMALMENMEWVWNEGPKVKWFFTDIFIWGRKFTSIGDNFAGLTFGQFMWVERYFELCINENAHYEKNLHLFLGSLYSASGEGFNHKSIESDAKWMRWMSKGKKEAILFNYTGLRDQLAKAFPAIFPPPDPNASAAKPVKSASGWIDVALSLAGKDIRMFHEYEQDDVWLVLKIISNVIEQSKAEQKAIEEAKKKRL